MVDKVMAIRERLGDAVGVLEGWGGHYMLGGIPAGISGVMLGVAIADLPICSMWCSAPAWPAGERAYRLLAAALSPGGSARSWWPQELFVGCVRRASPRPAANAIETPRSER